MDKNEALRSDAYILIYERDDILKNITSEYSNTAQNKKIIDDGKIRPRVKYITVLKKFSNNT